jgi:hypothetical protein
VTTATRTYTEAETEELRTALDLAHRHREYGYFGYMGMAGYASRRIGRPGCRVCELLGRELHLKHGRDDGKLYGGCLAWSEEED